MPRPAETWTAGPPEAGIFQIIGCSRSGRAEVDPLPVAREGRKRIRGGMRGEVPGLAALSRHENDVRVSLRIGVECDLFAVWATIAATRGLRP